MRICLEKSRAKIALPVLDARLLKKGSVLHHIGRLLDVDSKLARHAQRVRKLHAVYWMCRLKKRFIRQWIKRSLNVAILNLCPMYFCQASLYMKSFLHLALRSTLPC